MPNVKVHSVQTVELQAPTSLTQKLKLMGRIGQFTNTPTQTNKVDRYFDS